jgi:hypothetical protein
MRSFSVAGLKKWRSLSDNTSGKICSNKGFSNRKSRTPMVAPIPSAEPAGTWATRGLLCHRFTTNTTAGQRGRYLETNFISGAASHSNING